ncbi:hypothetical protein MLD38_013279 [Melastoma candidum]|uniref:Uncharacterized protein n=1 Tax=Melastoma candidum TaxID=119954 RepID=A0ACB9R925_9MYRT|nr:hypothetical protein MLD38_013279 [Melastoma candidum]
MYKKNHVCRGGALRLQSSSYNGGGESGRIYNDDGGRRAAAGRDLVWATSFGVQRRRKRMARCRRRRPSSVTFGATSQINPLPPPRHPWPHVPRLPPSLPCWLAVNQEKDFNAWDTTTRGGVEAVLETSKNKKAMDRMKLRFLFEKELKNSDVSPFRRMVLPKKSAEAHLPMLDSKEGIIITMDDIDGIHVWSFKYRFWPNNNGRMYVLENTGDFVSTHGLQPGDSIAVYQNDQAHKFVIQAKKAGEEEDAYNETRKNATGYIQNQECPEVNDIIDSFDMIYSTMKDDEGMSFVYDTTSANYSPLDFLGGCMTNYARIAPPETFASVENFCSEDFS